MIVNHLREANIRKIHADLDFILDCFQEVLTDLGEDALAQQLLRPNQSPPPSALQQPRRNAQTYSIAFQLLNMV